MTESSKSFNDFNLHPQLNQSIQDLGYAGCTPIQERCLPILLKGQDIAGLAQTGTGKTAAFLIPLIERILRSQDNSQEFPERLFKDWQSSNFILILVPTRELVTQVYDNLNKLIQHTSLKSVFLYGGVGYEEQKSGLKKPFQFIVSTPGRLIDLYKEGFVDFKQVRGIVFDEADRMFDMGFQQDVFFILRRVPQDRQLLMFSATLNLHVTEMAYSANSNPIEIDVSRDKVTTENIEDFIIHLGKEEKPKYLLSIFKKYSPKQVIIFSNFKNKVPRIAQFLNENGFTAMGISSLMTQVQRNRVIESFKSENKHNIMVATDVAARGLDIKGVDLVINFELPDDAENYVHRIGRTGRAEQKGKAISFVSDRDVESLMRIEDYLKEKIEAMWLEDADFVTDFKPMPEEEFRRPMFEKRRDERGREDRGPRRHNGDARRDQPPRKSYKKREVGENPYEATGGEREPAAAAPSRGGVHRDRKLGRHKNARGPDNETRTDRPQHKKKFHKNDRPKRDFGNKKSYPQRTTAKSAASKSLWGRIKESVSKLVNKR